MDSFVWMHIAVCAARPVSFSSSIVVIVWFPEFPLVICAQSSSDDWTIIHTNIRLVNTLPFHGHLYGVTRVGRKLVLP